MRKLINQFKGYLTENRARKEDFDQGGIITLYHYPKPDTETLVLDPKYGAQYYSKNDYIVSDVPRVFFYVDPADKERYFYGYNMFRVDVPSNQVYDLTADDQGYVAAARHPIYGLRNREEWNVLLEKIREDYGGVFYDTGRLKIVTWFSPIEVSRVPQEEQAQLEGNQER